MSGRLHILAPDYHRAHYIARVELNIDPHKHARSVASPTALRGLGQGDTVVVSDVYAWPYYAQDQLHAVAASGAIVLSVQGAKELLDL